MKWLMINDYFPPEIGSASFLFYELGRKLVARGHEVTVLTGFPRYNIDSSTLPEKYKKRMYLEENMDGIKVIRIRTFNLPRYVAIARGIDQFISACIFCIRGVFFKRRAFELVLVYSPPLPLGLTGMAIGRMKRIPFVFNIQDLFPQSAIDLGILNNKILISLFEKLEKFIYRKADLVTAHSEGNRKHVLSKGVEPEKVATVPNWIDIDAIKPGIKENDFRREYGLGKKFVVSFAGVIGYSQDLDTVIETANFHRDNKDVLFLIVGDGVEKARLQEKAKVLGLGNVMFLPMQPKAKYELLIAASDVCLVNLHKEVKTPVVPSKLLSIMAAGRPVLASLPLPGDAPKIIEASGCGICVEAGDAGALAKGLSKMIKEEQFRNECGEKGREYAEKNFSLTRCVEIYENINKLLKEEHGV
jgi:colanic acid biosynthesis glycosyl transferase WcaI